MKLSVVGLGKLGSPLAAVLASKGHNVIGIDLNKEYVDLINKGIAPFDEPQLQNLISANRARLCATQDYIQAITETEVTFVIVPTPSDSSGLFSNRFVLEAVKKIGECLREKKSYHLVVITSTVMPGSTEGEIQEMLEQSSGKVIGQDLGLCYSPEFIALGSVVRDMLYPDMILIGESDPLAGNTLQKIYETVCENSPPIRKMNLINAELTKLAVNTFITTKISYANMLAGICELLPNSDVEAVTQAIGLDSRIGKKYLKAAVPFGGPCFPRDNIAFTALANQLGARADIAEATQNINIDQMRRLLNSVKKVASGKRIAVLGLSYKPGTYVVEKSPGVEIANLLASEGYIVSAYDPMASSEAKKHLEKSIHIACSLEECTRFSETLLIMTTWPDFTQQITPEFIKQLEFCKTIIDCWRILPEKTFSKICALIHLGKGTIQEHSLV